MVNADDFEPLFASDLAREVRSEFESLIQHGVSPAAAAGGIFQQFAGVLSDPDEGPVVFVAVAVLQWRERGLQAVVRDAALELIGSGEAQAAWGRRLTDVDAGARRQLLDELATALTGAEAVE
jgi:hypothetical protein